MQSDLSTGPGAIAALIMPALAFLSRQRRAFADFGKSLELHPNNDRDAHAHANMYSNQHD